MATDFFNFGDDKEKEQQNQNAQKSLSGSSGGVITSNSPQQGSGPSSSGAFTGLNQYLDVNKDNQTSQNLAGVLEGKTNEASQANEQAKSQFMGASDQATAKYDQELFDRVLSNPVEADKNQEIKQKVQSALKPSYNGPTQFANESYYAPAYQKNVEAVSNAETALDAQKRPALLNNLYGLPAGATDNYTAGQRRLDSALIQQDPDAQAKFSNQLSQSKQGLSNFNSLSQYLQDYAKNNQYQTGLAGAEANAAFGINPDGTYSNPGPSVVLDKDGNPVGTFANAIPSLVKQLEQRAAKNNSISGLQQSAVYDRANKNSLTDADIQRLGLFKNARIWNLNPASYLNYGSKANSSNVATKEEADRLLALQDLAGKTNSLIVPEQAGTFDPNNNVTFDTERFAKDRMAQEAHYFDTTKGSIFNADLGGQTVRDILNNQGLSDQQKLDQIMRFNDTVVQGKTNDHFYGPGRKSLSEIVNGPLNDPYWALKNGYTSTGIQQANDIVKLIQSVQGFNRRLQ